MQGPDCFLQRGSDWINDCSLSLTAPAEVIHCINWILMQSIDLKANNRMNVLIDGEFVRAYQSTYGFMKKSGAMFARQYYLISECREVKLEMKVGRVNGLSRY